MIENCSKINLHGRIGPGIALCFLVDVMSKSTIAQS